MRKLLNKMLRIVPLLALIMSFAQTNAQRPFAPSAEEDFLITLQNVVQTAPNVLEFDLYVLDTDPGQELQMATFQGGINFNPLILNGTAITATMTIPVAGSSQLPASMAPISVSTVNVSALGVGLVRIAGRAAPGCGSGFVISTEAPGTRLITLRMTAAGDFTANSTPDFIFNSNSVSNPLFPTRFAYYAAATCLNTQATITPGVNANVLENPVLNGGCDDPLPFNVTGGGSYCEGGPGVSINLSGSQPGVNYTLNPGGPTLPGTGAPITFVNIVLPGSYTVTALSDGTDPDLCLDPVNMTGGADVTVIPPEVSTVTIFVDYNPVCTGQVIAFLASPVNGGVDPLYEWFVNGVSQAIPSFTNVFNYIPVNGDQVYVVMFPNQPCSAGNPESNTVTMAVNPLLPVSISIDVNQNNVCAGAIAEFTAIPMNPGTTPVYQWFVNGVLQAATGTTFSYVPENTDVVYATLFSNEPCSTNNPAISNSIDMIVQPVVTPEVTVVADPAGAVTTGTLVTFTATPVNGGPVPTYEWFVNGGSASLVNPFAYIPSDGDEVYVVMTSNAPCLAAPFAVSDILTMVVLPVVLPPAVFDVTGGGEYCSDEGGVEVFLSDSEIGVTYTLYKDAIPFATIPGDGNPINFGFLLTGTYTVSGTNGGGTTDMNGSAVIVEIPAANPVVTIAVDQNDVCAGTLVTFSTVVEDAGATPAFLWTVNGIAAGSGLSTFSYIPLQGDAVEVMMTSSLPCSAPVMSNEIVMTVIAPVAPMVYLVVDANNVVAGTLVTFTATPVNGGTPIYAWFVNGLPAGSNNAQFTYAPANGDQVWVEMTTSLSCVTQTTALSDIITMVVLPAPCPLTTWTGLADHDWNNLANWNPCVPQSGTEVIIPGGCPNYPTIEPPLNNAAACLVTITDLTLHDGASLVGQQYMCILNDAVVERTIVNTNFHLLSSPVVTSTFGDVFLPIYYNEVFARKYDEPSGDWMNQNILDFLHIGKGYSVQMATVPQNATFTGTLNAADITLTLSNLNPGSDINRIGWNLLGNPFPSAIDWDIFSTGDYDGQVAVWDQAGAGNYIYWNGTVGSLLNGIIPAQNGFFVKTSIHGAALTIPLTAQLHSSQSFYKESVANALEIRADGNNYFDAAFVHFNNEATAAFDSDFDAFKLQGLETAPQFYSMAAGYKLSINELPFEGNEVVNLGFNCGIAGTYSLTASGMESFSSSTPVLLEDLLAGTIQDLRQNPVYSFNYTAGDNENRFRLHFKNTIGITNPDISGIMIYSFDHTVAINNSTNLAGEIQIYDLTGRELKNARLSSSETTRIPMEAAIGTYIVKVTTARGPVNQKVFIK